MIYLLTGIVRILFAFAEGIVKLALYLLRAFGLIVPALYLLIMFAVNLATDNAVLENHYPLFVSGLCLSMAGAVLLFFRNTIKNPIKAVRVNRKARELDQYEQELIERERHMNELEQRCTDLERQLAQVTSLPQTNVPPRYDIGNQAPYAPATQAIRPQVGSAPVGGSAPGAYSVPSPAGMAQSNAPQSGTGMQAPAYGAPSGTAPSAQTIYPTDPLRQPYNEAPIETAPATGYSQGDRTEFRSGAALSSDSQTTRFGREIGTDAQTKRHGLFGRGEEKRDNGRNATDMPFRGREARRQDGRTYDSASGSATPASNGFPLRQNVSTATLGRTETPEIFRVRQDPRYLVYDYSDRRELYLETAHGLEFIKTDYKR